MKTLIAYATRYGATRDCAEKIAALIGRDTDLIEIGKAAAADPGSYDRIIIGSPVYLSRVPKAVQRFASAHESILMCKKVALFLCCIQDMEEPLRQQFRSGFSDRLIDHAVMIRGLGGRIQYDRLRPTDQFLMRLIAGKKRTQRSIDLDTITDQNIRSFANDFLCRT